MLSVAEQGVQARVLGASPTLLDKKPSELLSALRRILLDAFDDGLSRTSQDKINAWVKLLQEGQPIGPNKTMVGSHSIVGGVKDFKRHPSSAHLVRDDSAWIHFTLTLDWDGKQALKLLAYDFEIVFPEGYSPPFLRIDLNPEGHATQDRELRSHMHPGNDDLLFPAPVMTPEEILHLFIHGLRPRDKDKLRA